MVSSGRTLSRSSVAPRWPWIGLILALLSPVTVFVAIVGVKTGLLAIGIAYDVLTSQVAFYLAGLGMFGAILAIVGGVTSFRRSWLIVACALVVSGLTVTGFAREMRSQRDVLTSKVAADYQPGAGVSTDPTDPIGFPEAIMAERRADGADPLSSTVGPNGCEITPLMMQSAPGAAGYALQQSGFDIRDLGVNRAIGVHTSTWFERTYDAAIRIRPGRTDVRVTPRDGAHDKGASCRLARHILAELQPRP